MEPPNGTESIRSVASHADPGGRVAMVIRQYAVYHLAHWLTNAYLPALDWWIALGAPGPLSLVYTDGSPWKELSGNSGGTAWPYDGFGDHEAIALGYDSWPGKLLRPCERDGVSPSGTVVVGTEAGDTNRNDRCAALGLHDRQDVALVGR